jgi:nucleoside-diphosphate-sugar epimerase
VDDAVNGILRLAEKTASSADLYGEAFNFSPDEPIRVKDLIREISSIMGSDSDPEIQNPSAPFETEHLDNAKARDMLGWAPRYNLRDGLAEAVGWYSERSKVGQKA